MQVQAKIIRYQVWYQVVIFYTYPNGKERLLMTVEKCFQESLDAEIFLGTDKFKNIIKSIEANFLPVLIR